jgi:methylenetetrahydrofolate dehydrogenase (NADP+)/methenyltetrahydrofolate cyclohydrolase
MAVMELIRRSDARVEGAEAVVVGASMLAGMPTSLQLIHAGATVTVTHVLTRDLESHVRRAEILVAAAGVPGLIRGDWIREGAVVIDVGTTRVGDRLVGDVEFQAAAERAAAITPVPGGVGPMTIAMLLRNTLHAAHRGAVHLGLLDPASPEP